MSAPTDVNKKPQKSAQDCGVASGVSALGGIANKMLKMPILQRFCRNLKPAEVSLAFRSLLTNKNNLPLSVCLPSKLGTGATADLNKKPVFDWN